MCFFRSSLLLHHDSSLSACPSSWVSHKSVRESSFSLSSFHHLTEVVSGFDIIFAATQGHNWVQKCVYHVICALFYNKILHVPISFWCRICIKYHFYPSLKVCKPRNLSIPLCIRPCWPPQAMVTINTLSQGTQCPRWRLPDHHTERMPSFDTILVITQVHDTYYQKFVLWVVYDIIASQITYRMLTCAMS